MRNPYSKHKHCKCGKLIINTAKRCQQCWMKKLHKLLHKIGYPAFIDGRKKELHFCSKCKRKIHYTLWKKNKICGKCRARIKGKLHHNYTHGKTTKEKIYKCIDCKQKISMSSGVYGNQRCRQCANIGKLSPTWIDGRSYIPYPFDFNDKLKKIIHKRDNYTCQKCSQKQNSYYRKLDVHHIDYDKQNCQDTNLITLCNKCNIKVNHNRDYWYAYFIYLMEDKCLNKLLKIN